MGQHKTDSKLKETTERVFSGNERNIHDLGVALDKYNAAANNMLAQAKKDQALAKDIRAWMKTHPEEITKPAERILQDLENDQSKMGHQVRAQLAPVHQAEEKFHKIEAKIMAKTHAIEKQGHMSQDQSRAIDQYVTQFMKIMEKDPKVRDSIFKVVERNKLHPGKKPDDSKPHHGLPDTTPNGRSRNSGKIM